MFILRAVHVLIGIILIFLVAPNKSGAIAFSFVLGGCGIMAITTLYGAKVISRLLKRVL